MYASCVWNPTGQSNSGLRKELESVQRKAAGFVHSDWSYESSPTAMIKNLEWISTEQHRKIASIIMLHKIINKNIAIPITILPKRSRGENNFQQKLGRILAYSNLFVPTVTTGMSYQNKSEISNLKIHLKQNC